MLLMCYLFVRKGYTVRLYLIKLLRNQGMPENKLHVIFVALIVSGISYSLYAFGGFLNCQQINRINTFGKFVDLGFAALHFVMYQNISEWLTVDYLIVYKVLPIVSHIYFHQKSSTLAYIPDNIVMSK